MRKRVVEFRNEEPVAAHERSAWLDVERIAEVHLTSEDVHHPVEEAFAPNPTAGWRAAYPGPQCIRIAFDSPQHIRRIQLRFVESEVTRTQEFVLRWSPDEGRTFRDVVRQQWNFNPESATAEFEDYTVDLPGVTVLELFIVPDVAGGSSVATVQSFRVA